MLPDLFVESGRYTTQKFWKSEVRLNLNVGCLQFVPAEHVERIEEGCNSFLLNTLNELKKADKEKQMLN